MFSLSPRILPPQRSQRGEPRQQFTRLEHDGPAAHAAAPIAETAKETAAKEAAATSGSARPSSARSDAADVRIDRNARSVKQLPGMRSTRRGLPVRIFVVVLASVAVADAQCDFYPGQGTRLKVPMIRAYDGCDDVTANTATEVGMEACSPVKPSPRNYHCTTRPLSCSNETERCPVRYCGGEPAIAHSYRYCIDNSDCPVSPPESTGVCEYHPENLCVPGSSGTSYGFQQGGTCTLSATSKVESDCSLVAGSSGALLGLPVRACHVTTLKARCRGIVSSGTTPISGLDHDGWTLTTLTRATLDDAIGGDMTQVDFPLTFAFEMPRHGAIRLDSNTAEALVPLLGTFGAALPPCIDLQPVEARVLDPDGETFATVGLATRP